MAISSNLQTSTATDIESGRSLCLAPGQGKTRTPRARPLRLDDLLDEGMLKKLTLRRPTPASDDYTPPVIRCPDSQQAH